jgi:hypothetical protein
LIARGRTGQPMNRTAAGVASIGVAEVVTEVLADVQSPEELATTAGPDHRTGLMMRTPCPHHWNVTNLAVIGSRKSSAPTIAGQRNVLIPAIVGRRNVLTRTIGSQKGLPMQVASQEDPPTRTASPLAPMDQPSLFNPALRSKQPRHQAHQLRPYRLPITPAAPQPPITKQTLNLGT